MSTKKLELTPEMFAGNFIRECSPEYRKQKNRNLTSFRRVELICLNCGNLFKVNLSAAKRIQQKCCSKVCGATLNSVTGGNENHPLYARWLSMRQRCLNTSTTNYNRYGGRGITIAEDLLDFKDYTEYISSLPNYSEQLLTTHQVDRINNNGNYEKGNLRLTTRNVQIANQGTNSRGCNMYKGVNWNKHFQRWVARIDLNHKCLFSKSCLTELDALQARNDFIKQHKLPHPIQLPSN